MAEKRHRVLVIDDEAADREAYVRMLSAARFQVSAMDRAEALEGLLSESFDLIVTDLAMADMDGLSVLERLREMDVRAPVILLSASWNNAATLRASASGALCLSKPIGAEVLVAAARQRIEAMVSPAIRIGERASEVAETVTATVAKNEFGRVMDTAVQKGRVVITKHEAPRAVLLSFDEYTRLTEPRESELDVLTDEFDELFATMQSPTAREAARAVFSMSPEELGAAAAAKGKA